MGEPRPATPAHRAAMAAWSGLCQVKFRNIASGKCHPDFALRLLKFMGLQAIEWVILGIFEDALLNV